MQFNPHDIIELNGSKFEVRPNLMNDSNVYLMHIDGERTCQEMCNSPFKRTYYNINIQSYNKELLIKAIQIEPKVQDEVDRVTSIYNDMESFTPERQSEF